VTVLNLLAMSIGIGLLFTLLLTEAFGLAAGGLVVPGYVALKLMQPFSVALTLLAAFLTFVAVRTLASFVVIYGRRKTALMILIGYLLGSFFDLVVASTLIMSSGAALAQAQAQSGQPGAYVDLAVIGYIIPGLIAIWFERQGVFRTLVGLFLAAVLVRLTLIVVVPDALQDYESAFGSPGPVLEQWMQGDD
jgi:poly-gamma-glutamate biosynthesis protein PgsC/CapC